MECKIFFISGFIKFKFRQLNLWSSAHPYISGLICLISVGYYWISTVL